MQKLTPFRVPNLIAFEIADPSGLMEWRGKDRAMATLGAGRDAPVNRRRWRRSSAPGSSSSDDRDVHGTARGPQGGGSS
jgi:hypothetical protein